jgi:peptide/nickel transport system permease protein
MAGYVARRLLAALVTVWIVATAGFLLVEIIPGDPARQLAGPGASAESLAAIREAYGFDDPLPLRYVESMTRMASGDLGYSFAKGEPVTDALLRSLPSTLLLTTLAFGLEVLIAIPLALWVVSRGGFVDRLLVILAGFTAAIPAFLVGLLLIYLFA